ncbi:RNA recognition motif domain-containing protein [Cinnamomum micranthum f. kanehirae]|uniref:RNA recognition motif domain-containing protein n=1 Tax=Cinnamomum micranthum f. kanehirae TaxID=337451 RepID=A0A443NUP5_9MAGN|nr:RNA recognition motif domain-containing protein [Cinnamomum micranthum f. kanehirae]
MDFDEYDYLEKAVEGSGTARKSSEKKKDAGEKPERSSRNRQEDEDDSRGSKRSRLQEAQNGHKRDRDERERGSRSDRRDKDRERGGRDVDREHDNRDRGRERDRGRDKEREREREKERPRRPRAEQEKDGKREMERGRSRDMEGKERERENDIRERDGRRFKEKKEVVEPEVDPERDQRTVFAYQMPLKANEKDVYDFFSKAGKVRDVRLIMDRNSRRSKGVGYIEFYDAMSVPMAIALSGHQLMGQPVMVKPSEAEKNLVQSTASAGGSSGLTGPGVARKLYVGNLHFNMTEDQLRQVFEPFGPVEQVQLPTDMETGQCKGFGFVQFAHLEHAKAAQSLNGKLDIAGRVIKVSAVTDHAGVPDVSLNARSRAMLMQKLDRTGIATSIAGSLGVPVINGPPPNQQAVGLPVNGQAALAASALPALVATSSGSEPVGDPSECLLLKNMFDPNTESEPDFDLDIKEEVQEECSNFGHVKHIHVDKNSSGYVYLRFDSVAASVGAQRAMHMRWFARRLISAIFMRPHEYEAKFGNAA